MTTGRTAFSLEARISRGEIARSRLQADLASRRAILPLRYWRQQAHFTTPASDAALARKALEEGTAPTARALGRFGLTPKDLAERIGVSLAPVEELLARPRPAPAVMLDGEDALALRDDVLDRGLGVAADLLRDPSIGSGSLRYFRPPGFNLDRSVRDLLTFLRSVVSADRFALDGIVFPKVNHPEEVDFLYGLLDEAEDDAGVPHGQLRVALLIESGWAAANLPAIARASASRLSALIFGLADYSAELSLPSINTDHEMASWIRSEIINVAGAVGVPAIDGMTLAYPVVDPDLSPRANRDRFLDRMALVYHDARRARELGMHGKWVGHPAQLFSVLLAFDLANEPETLAVHAANLRAYRQLVEHEGRGAAMINGLMSDRATARHSMAIIRQAVAVGKFPPHQAVALGVVEPGELGDLGPLGSLADAP